MLKYFGHLDRLFNIECILIIWFYFNKVHRSTTYKKIFLI